MRVSIFIDGSNFYRSMLRNGSSLRVDYDKMVRWIAAQTGGDFNGAYYYVGMSDNPPPQVESFVRNLALRPGFFVRTERRVVRTTRCQRCHEIYQYTQEKRVDTRLVADMIHFAANNSYDTAVLVSGDEDFVPAVEAVNALGKHVWLAIWARTDLSSELRKHCFGQINLLEGLTDFRREGHNGESVA